MADQVPKTTTPHDSDSEAVPGTGTPSVPAVSMAALAGYATSAHLPGTVSVDLTALAQEVLARSRAGSSGRGASGRGAPIPGTTGRGAA